MKSTQDPGKGGEEGGKTQHKQQLGGELEDWATEFSQGHPTAQ